VTDLSEASKEVLLAELGLKSRAERRMRDLPPLEG
jgi:hypothetical protein